MSLGEQFKKYFNRELFTIQDEKLRNLTVKIFDEVAEEDFFEVGASKSGRYHPSCTIGKFGLAKHTKLVVWWAQELYQTMKAGSNINMDYVIMACLLHDIVKNGCRTVHGVDRWKQYNCHVVKYHGSMLSTIIFENYPEVPHKVMQCIQGHMGTWSAKDVKTMFDARFMKDTEYQEVTLVHLADFCASRKVEAIYEVLNDE